METTGSKYLFPAYQSHKSESRHSETSRERSRTLPGYRRAATLRKKKERQKSILKKKRGEWDREIFRRGRVKVRVRGLGVRRRGRCRRCRSCRCMGRMVRMCFRRRNCGRYCTIREGFDPTQEEMAFGFIPISFSPIERYNEPNLEKLRTEEDKKRAMKLQAFNKDLEQKYLLKFLRHYDVDRIRENRISQSFAIGRKINQQENSYERLNTVLENQTLGLCMRRPKFERLTANNLINHKALTGHHVQNIKIGDILNTLDFKNRNEKLYQKIATDTLEVDIFNELKKKYGLKKRQRKMRHGVNLEPSSPKKNPLLRKVNLIKIDKLKEYARQRRVQKRKLKQRKWKNIKKRRGYSLGPRNSMCVDPNLDLDYVLYNLKNVLARDEEKQQGLNESKYDTERLFRTATFSSYHKQRDIHTPKQENINKKMSSNFKINNIHKRYSLPRRMRKKSQPLCVGEMKSPTESYINHMTFFPTEDTSKASMRRSIEPPQDSPIVYHKSTRNRVTFLNPDQRKSI
ncbi:unnamed protein product [Moneuplotes crassus]|uniref:Uncharacterized protein n=1 Tax=Euplotes crassus TaxID=5936 RepID=A0AAD1X1E7_EUPCR|nr:unnamed protein product [Moneuplotes crassus]